VPEIFPYKPCSCIEWAAARSPGSGIINSNGTSSSRSDDDESDLDSDDLLDLQFQAEMEQYDAIVEKERQR
jgi:hypothetical protein